MSIGMIVLQVVAVTRSTGLSLRAIVGGVWPPASCAGLGIAVGVLPFLFLRSHLPNLAVDAIASMSVLAVYTLALRRFFPSLRAEILSQGRAVVAGRRSGGQPPASTSGMRSKNLSSTADAIARGDQQQPPRDALSSA